MSHEQVSRDSRKQAAMSFDPRGEAARQRGDANGRDEHGEPKREARPVERHEKSCRQDLIFAVCSRPLAERKDLGLAVLHHHHGLI